MAQQLHAPGRVAERGDSGSPYAPSGHGWAVFCGVMFLIVAGANTLWGIAALAKDDNFAADELLVGNLTAWGLLSLLFAFFQLSTGVLILRQRAFGAFLGILLASLHAVTSLLWIGAYPLWTTVALVIDGLIIYALSVHGGDWS